MAIYPGAFRPDWAWLKFPRQSQRVKAICRWNQRVKVRPDPVPRAVWFEPRHSWERRRLAGELMFPVESDTPAGRWRSQEVHKTFTIPLLAPDTCMIAIRYRRGMIMTRNVRFVLIATLILILPVMPVLPAEKAVALTTFARLPVKEITVFKDGHAFVAHEGELPTDEQGNVLMDYLPTPVVGTFWPYCADKRARLTGVVASQRRVLVEHTALNLRELLEANINVDAVITEAGTNHYEATILGIPARSSEELTATSPPNAPERLPEKGSLVLLKTAGGVKAIPLDRIQDVTFKGSPKPASASGAGVRGRAAARVSILPDGSALAADVRLLAQSWRGFVSG